MGHDLGSDDGDLGGLGRRDVSLLLAAMKGGPVSLPPSMVRVVRQSGHDADCGVAALGMLLGLRDHQALALCAAEVPTVLEYGMSWREVRRAAERAGAKVKLVRRGRYSLDDDTGMLGVSGKRRNLEHFVFLWAGRIVEGNTELWLDAEDYLRHYGYQAGSLLVRDE